MAVTFPEQGQPRSLLLTINYRVAWLRQELEGRAPVLPPSKRRVVLEELDEMEGELDRLLRLTPKPSTPPALTLVGSNDDGGEV